MKLLDSFTDRCFFDIFNKHFEFTYSTLRYWLAPVVSNKAFNVDSSPEELLDWSVMRDIVGARELAYSPEDDPKLAEGRYFVDRADRSRRFIVENHVPGIGPLDKVPNQVQSEQLFENIRDYSYNAGKKRRWQQVKWKIPDWEPVFYAQKLLHRINFLDPPPAREIESNKEAYIVPSTFSISMIPSEAVRSVMLLPSVSSRIDGYLIAWEMCKALGMPDIRLDVALEAITKDSDNTDQAAEIQQTD